MAHPVIDGHLAAKDTGPGQERYDQPDAPAIAIPRVTFGSGDNTPHTVAGMATLAVLGLLIFRLSGFRFVVGGAAGVLK